MENKNCKNCLNICECCEYENSRKCETCKPFTSKFYLSKYNRCNSKTKYLPGDKVLVRPDLKPGRYYSMADGSNSNIAVGGMINFAGKVVTISYLSDRQYRIKEYTCFWTDEMFEYKVE